MRKCPRIHFHISVPVLYRKHQFEFRQDTQKSMILDLLRQRWRSVRVLSTKIGIIQSR